MNQINKISYSKGINQDISKSKYPQGSYYVLTNGTIISGDSTDSTEISSIAGNVKILNLPKIKDLHLSSLLYSTTVENILKAKYGGGVIGSINHFLADACPSYLTDSELHLSIIGYVTVIDRTFLFCKELTTDRYSSIFELILDESIEPTDTGYSSLILRYINDNLNFAYIGLEAIGVFENENITHLYWADGTNQLRLFNVADENKFITHYTQLDIVPEVNISIPKLRNVTATGNLSVGMVQYSFQYFNSNGQVSVFMPPTDLIHLTTEPEGIILYQDGKANFYHGADSGLNANKAVTIQLLEVDTRFDSIRIVRIFHNSIAELPVISIVAEQKILDSNNITFIDDGNIFLGNLSISEFKKVSIPIIPKTIATKDSILFAGNIQEDLFKSGVWDNFCTRCYRFASDKTANVYSSESLITGKTVVADEDNYVSDWQGLNDNMSNYTVNAYNIPEFSDPSINNNYNQNTYQFKYYSDGKTLGGNGPNISFKFTVKEAIIDNADALSETHVNRVWPIYDDGFGQQNSVSQDGIFTNDYRSPYIASKYKTYQKDDIYRFALVVYSKTGLVSDPKWIADIRMPLGANISTGFEEIMLNYCSFTGNNNGTTNMNILGIDFKIKFPPDLLNEIQGYSIVRCQRDSARHILGNGIITPYIFGYGGGTNNGGTFDIKWSPENRDSLARKKSSKGHYADFVSSSFHRIQGYIGTGAHNYSGFTYHDYNLLNEVNTNFPLGTPITDTGVCAFISPEHLFTNNLKIKSTCKVVPISSYKTAGVFGIDHVLWSDYSSELLFMDALKLSPRVQLDNIYPSELDSFNFLSPLEDIKIRKYYSNGSGTVSSEYTLVNGLTYGTAVIDHLSFGSNILMNIKEQRSIGASYLSPLKATIKEVFHNDSGIIDSGEFIFNCNIKQQSSPYGGQSLSSILNSVYISTGNYIKATSDNNDKWFSLIAGDNSPAKTENLGSISNPISEVGAYPRGTDNCVGSTVFGGDVFLSMFQYLSQYGTDLTTEGITTAVARYSTTLLIPVESTINCNLRHDVDIFTISKTNNRNIGEPALFRAESKSGGTVTSVYYHDYIQEKDLYLYNTVFSKENTINTFYNITNTKGITNKNTTRVMASLPKLNGEFRDSWSVFGVNTEIELLTTYGDLYRLYNFKDTLYGFQNIGIARLAVNDKTTSQDPNNPLIIGTTGILSYYQYITDSSGTEHKYSVISTESILMYFDSSKNKIFYLTGDDGDLSSTLGLNSYFLENKIAGDTSTFPSIITSYDTINKQILFRLRYNDTDKLSNVLVFNQFLKLFTNFIDADPNIYINTHKHLLTQKVLGNVLTDNYGLYLENNGLQNTWYNIYTPLKCTFIINPTNNELIKMFDIIEFMTSSAIVNDTDKFNVLNLPVTSIRVYSDYQDTLPIDLLSLNDRGQYFQKQRNRTFRVNRLRDKLDTNPKNQLARMKDYYIAVDVEFNKELLSSPLNTEDIKFTLKDLFVSYRDLKTTQL